MVEEKPPRLLEMIRTRSKIARSRAVPILVGLYVLAGWAAAEPVWVQQQGARLIIGQDSFTRQNPASSREVLGAAGGIAVAGDKLLVADGNKVGARVGSEPVSPRVSNHRVLIYNALSSFIPHADAVLPQGKPCPACVGVPDVVLGQVNFETFTPDLNQSGFQNPTHIASDGTVLAVSDTDNNRVLIWNQIPGSNDQPASVVIGQPDFTSNKPATSRSGLRGPQGVWIDGGRLFVADTVNGRVLIWNRIPTSNGAPADVVLGQQDFDTRPEPDLTQSNFEPRNNRMLDPVSVTVNNGRVFVSDLGFSRVLIFLTVPTQNAAPADVVVGQPDMDSGVANNSPKLCELLPENAQPGIGVPVEDPKDTDGDGDIDGDDTYPRQYPRRCEKTLNFPRFALSDGQRLFIADAGNDRILVYNQVPLSNGVAADVVIGQADFQKLEESDGAGSLRSPTALAHDGTNLYVADPFSRRILVFTPGEDLITRDGIRNGASFSVHSIASVTFQDAPSADQKITITLSDANERFPEIKFEYTAKTGDTNLVVRDTLLAMINDHAANGGPVYGLPIEGEGVHAVGRIKFAGSSQPGDVVTLRVADQVYEAQVVEGDPPERMVDRLKFLIDARRDPNVVAEREFDTTDTLLLTSRVVGPAGNQIPLQVTASEGAKITFTADASLHDGSFPFAIRLVSVEEGPVGEDLRLTTEITGSGMSITSSGSRFSIGSNGRELPSGSMGVLFGQNFSDAVYMPPSDASRLPTELGGVQVYVNGVLSPLFSVTPEQINFQVPWEKPGTSISVYVRHTMPDGAVQVSAARATPATRAAPGLFAFPGLEPRKGVVLHGAGQATGVIALATPANQTGNADEAGFVINPPGVDVKIHVNGREYFYVTQQGDTLATARDNMVNLINNSNNGQGDPEVTAVPGQQGFFSARATVEIGGQIRAGDTVSIQVRDRIYSYVVVENDTLAIIRNILVQRINLGPNLDGLGDPEVTARRLEEVGSVRLEVVARDLGTSGNSIPFTVAVTPESAVITATSSVAEDGVLGGGQTPPVVILVARQASPAANEITYDASSSDAGRLVVTARSTNLCCGNEPYSLVTEENPAVPGESIIVMATGLGLTSPQPANEGLESGEPTPASPHFLVPLVADDFVSSLAGGKTATVEFVGLMPGQVGIYQLNLRLNEDLPDDRNTPLAIFQVRFASNTITFPVKNLKPRQTAATATADN
jgi:uncharacterized protein (TIGR03437 family)